MEQKNMRELLNFAKDGQRLDAAIEKVIAGIDSGTINLADLNLAAGPLRPSTLDETQQAYVADMMQQAAASSLMTNNGTSC